MQRLLPLLFLCFTFSLSSNGQFTRYIIKFKDKGTNPFSLSNPSQYLNQRSLDRRARYSIAIDSSDLPVTPRYVDSLRLAGNVTIINISKWLNQVAIQTSDAIALNKINSFPFVISTDPIAARNDGASPIGKKLDIPPTAQLPALNNSSRVSTAYYNYGQSADQVKIHNGDFLHNHGFRGEGMLMAMMDAGFFHYLSLPTFDSVRMNNQILGTWDFVANEASVDEDYYHGMQCFSTIAANMPGLFVGTAPKTSFYLFRTEDVSSEYPIEEQNWAAAAERADSLGVDITSTSLGYNLFDNAVFNHSYADMNGNTTIIARAANWAAKKGMLIVAAAGNEGGNTWHYVTTPGDADSSLCVGAVNTAGAVAGFSSFGPNSDGQTKPAVAAVGWNATVANPSDGQPSFNSGTSFATPNMAGITTCLWQAFPEISNMGIIHTLEASGTKATAPDDRVGFGIPDVKKAFVILQKALYTKQFNNTDCSASFQVNIKTDNSMQIEMQRKLETENNYTTITTLQNNDSYGMHNFSYSDDISNIALGQVIYRLKMVIATDTSYYLDSVTLDHLQNCNGIVPVNDIIIVQQQENAANVNVIIKRITPAKISIVIQNAAGQRVYKNEFQQAAGIETQSLSLKKILPGKAVYFLSVFIDNKKARTKEIISP